MTIGRSDEQTPLLAPADNADRQDEQQLVDFEKEDGDDPRQWPKRKKMINVAIISLMAVISPLASSMFSPAIGNIADDLHAPRSAVIGASTGFVITLGIGPVVLAPISETFGRRQIYIWCFSIFSLLQIPTALSPNIETLTVLRVICGFVGSCGVACGGGTIGDMFADHERAGVFGWYLLGPVVGPTLGPLFGGLVADQLSWRWIFWIAAIVSLLNSALAFVFLKETFPPVILEQRCRRLEKDNGGKYSYSDRDTSPLTSKILRALVRPMKILFAQPIVITMALYQATLFATMYSLYTNLQDIYSKDPYNFTTTQVGCLFLFPGAGYLVAVWFLVPRVDTIYNRLKEQNGGEGKPEFRLPIANVGAVALPVALLWFGWTTYYRVHWAASISSLFLYGLGQVCIFNTVQNYYIDAFTTYAASAIAAGAFVRSIAGGLIPVVSPAILDRLGYGWGWTFFAFLCLALAPSPTLFMKYGERLRKRYTVDL